MRNTSLNSKGSTVYLARNNLRQTIGALEGGGDFRPETHEIRLQALFLRHGKRQTPQGVSRAEFEYEIPRADAEAMLLLCEDVPIEKIRHEILVGGKLWELDVFEGQNQGLVLAEIELVVEHEAFEVPAWAGQEVSGDVRYFNSFLSKTPFATWN